MDHLDGWVRADVIQRAQIHARRGQRTRTFPDVDSTINASVLIERDFIFGAYKGAQTK
jgi:hypothetical protein